MKPTIRIAQRACEAAKARQTVVVWFDEHGQFAVASYGETANECALVKPVCNAIADSFDAGDLPFLGQTMVNTLVDRRRGDRKKMFCEYDRLRESNEDLLARVQAAEKFPRDHRNASGHSTSTRTNRKARYRLGVRSRPSQKPSDRSALSAGVGTVRRCSMRKQSENASSCSDPNGEPCPDHACLT